MIEARFAALAAWLSVQAGRSYVFGALAIGTAAWLAATLCGAVPDRINNFIGALTGLVSLILLVLLQNSANRGAIAASLKMDELIRAFPDASNRLMGAEELSEDELVAIRNNLRENP